MITFVAGLKSSRKDDDVDEVVDDAIAPVVATASEEDEADAAFGPNVDDGGGEERGILKA